MAFAFGSKYVQQLTTNNPDIQEPVDSAPTASISTELSGEISQHLQRLTKRDGTTKQKALQALTGCVAEGPSDQAVTLLPYWSFIVPRLVLDAHRGVRLETVRAMGAIAQAAGRRLAPQLGNLMGPWLLVQSDENGDVASVARQTMDVTFPGAKRDMAIRHCWRQMYSYLKRLLVSTPESLGDSKTESKEDLEERHCLALLGSCGMLAELARVCDGDTKMQVQLQELVLAPGFLKSVLTSAAPVARRAAYRLLSELARRKVLREDQACSQAPLILGMLREKRPECHADMWAGLLVCLQAYPALPAAVDLSKQVLPVLWSLIRHGFYGSTATSYPAVLPFMILMLDPKDPRSVTAWAQLLRCLWQGLETDVPGEAWDEGCACFTECAARGLAVAGAGSSPEPRAAAEAFLGPVLEGGILPAALGHGPAAPCAAPLVGSLATALPEEGRAAVLRLTRQFLLAAVQRLLHGAGAEGREAGGAETEVPALASWPSIQQCAEELSRALPVDVFTAEIARPLLEAMSRAGDASNAEAAQLLAALLLHMDGLDDETEGAQQGGREELAGTILTSLVSPKFAYTFAQLLHSTPAPHRALVGFLTAMHRSEAAGAWPQASQEIDDLLHAAPPAVLLAFLGAGEASGDDDASSARLLAYPAAARAACAMLDADVDADDRGAVADALGTVLVAAAGAGPEAAAWALTILVLAAQHVLSVAASLDSKAESDAEASEEEGPHASGRRIGTARHDIPGLTLWASRAGARSPAGLVLEIVSGTQAQHHATELGELAAAAAGSAAAGRAQPDVDALAEVCVVMLGTLHARSGAAPFTAAILSAVEGRGEGRVVPGACAALLATLARRCGAGTAFPTGAAALAVLDRLRRGCDDKGAAGVLRSISRDPGLLTEVLRAAAAVGDTETLVAATAGVADSLHAGDGAGCSGDGGTTDALAAPAGVLAELVDSIISDQGGQSSDPAPDSSRVRAAATLATTLGPALRRNKDQLVASRLPELMLHCSGEARHGGTGQAGLAWLDATLACCPPPSPAALCEALLGPRDGPEREGTEPAPAPYARGDSVWYWLPQGDWVPAQVEAVDTSVSPPSYAIALHGRVRETEGHRLARRTQEGEGAGVPPLPLNAAGAARAGPADAQLDPAPWPRPSPEETAALEELWGLFAPPDPDAGDAGAGAATSDPGTQLGALRQRLALAVLAACPPSGACWQSAARHVEEALRCVCGSMSGTLGTAATELAAAACEAAGVADMFSAKDLGPVLPFLDTLRADARLARSARVAAAMDRCRAARHRASRAVAVALRVERLRTLLQATAVCAVLGPPSAERSAPVQLGALVGAALGVLGEEGSEAAAPLADPAGELALQMLHALTQAAVVDDEGAARGWAVADAAAAVSGLSTVDCLLALALPVSKGAVPRTLAALATDLLLRAPVTLCVLAGEGDSEDETEDTPDPAITLVQLGVPPRLSAALLAAPASPAFLPAWGLMAAHLDALPAADAGRARLTRHLRDMPTVTDAVFAALLPLLPLRPGPQGGQAGRAGTPGAGPIAQLLLAALETSPRHAAEDAFARALYAGLLRTLPASARQWFAGLSDRGVCGAVQRYTAGAVSDALLAREFEALDSAQPGSSGKFSIRCSPAVRQALAVMEVEDGHSMELLIKLPAALPLLPPEVTCQNKVGVSDTRLRKWLLSVTAFLRAQNGTVAQGVALWQRNLDREFEGQEECLICYSILHPASGQLPKLACSTCRKRFHGACLYKWFRSSGKSTCPHCQSPW